MTRHGRARVRLHTDMTMRTPTSVVLDDMLSGASAKDVALDCLMERFVRPRWATPFEVTKRVVGGIVLLLGASLLAPVPLSNVPPALAIALIAFAYLEEDGVLLCAALAAALIMLAVAAVVAWETISATGWVPGVL